MDSIDGNQANTSNSSSESTVSTLADEVDCQESLPAEEEVDQPVGKQIRFLAKEWEGNQSPKRETKLTHPECKNHVNFRWGNRKLNRFSCCSVAYPNDPIEDPISLPHAAKKEDSNVTPLRKREIFGPPDLPSNFVSLDLYGYEAKYTGPLLKLNISGTTFTVKVSTLRRDPIVFDKILEDAEYIPELDEYYFERDPVVFRFVHAYLRHREMHLPLNICGPLLEKELEAWGLQMGFDLQRCCLGPVMESKSKLETLRKFEEAFSEFGHELNPRVSVRWQRLRAYVWRIITDTPKKRWLGLLLNKNSTAQKSASTSLGDEGRYNSSQFLDREASRLTLKHSSSLDTCNVTDSEGGGLSDGGRDSSQFGVGCSNIKQFNWRSLQKTPMEIILSRAYVIMQFVVVASLIVYMTISYVPELRESFGPIMNITKDNGTKNGNREFPVHRSYWEFDETTRQFTRPVLALRVFTWICVIQFTIDLIARAIFCPKFLKWLWSFYTITDIVSLLPFYVEGIIMGYVSSLNASAATEERVQNLFLVIDVFNMFKILVVSRIFRLLQRQRATRVLIYTIRTAAKNIVMVLELMLLCAVFFGTSIFFFDEKINSIFTGIWWAFTTMTTVGYGDVTPSTVPGRLIAVLCMVIGILLTSYTIPVLVNDFLLFYGHADQLAWMRRIHKSATAKRHTERRNLIAKRRIAQVRALIKQAVIGTGTIHENDDVDKNTAGSGDSRPNLAHTRQDKVSSPT